jgi:hypothetical protein
VLNPEKMVITRRADLHVPGAVRYRVDAVVVNRVLPPT